MLLLKMEIKVTNIEEMETIYIGDADEFLFINDNDEELEILLNELERMKMGSGKIYFGNFGEKFLIEKDFEF